MDRREEGRNGESRRTPFLSIGSNKPRLWGAEGGGLWGRMVGGRRGRGRGGEAVGAVPSVPLALASSYPCFCLCVRLLVSEQTEF